MLERTTLLSIDPGTFESGWVLMDTGTAAILDKGITDNTELVARIQDNKLGAGHFAIELIEPRGMPIGNSTLITVLWTGRFVQAFDGNTSMIHRRRVKLFLTGSVRAKDSNVNTAVGDMYHPLGTKSAKGTKKNPGPLYGCKSHIFAAIAVGLYWLEENGYGREHRGSGARVGDDACPFL